MAWHDLLGRSKSHHLDSHLRHITPDFPSESFEEVLAHSNLVHLHLHLILTASARCRYQTALQGCDSVRLFSFDDIPRLRGLSNQQPLPAPKGLLT